VKHKDLFSLGAHGAYLFAKPLVEKGVKLVVVTNQEMARDLKKTYVNAVTSFEEAMEMAESHTHNGNIIVLRKARRLIIS
jgi:urocanate hydratase